MPLFNGTLFQIDQKEMMRYAGLSPKVKEFPQDAIDSAIREALALAEPRGIWQILPYDPENGTIGGAHPLTLTGRSILRHLSQAWSVGVLAVTVAKKSRRHPVRILRAASTCRGFSSMPPRPLPSSTSLIRSMP